MNAKSMLTKSLWRLLLLLLVASFAPTAQAIDNDADQDGTDVNNTITAAANLLKNSYTLEQPVPIEIAVTNHGQKPAYIEVDEFGFLRTNVIVEDVNGSRIYPLYVYSPPAPPRYFWMTIDGEKIYTHPVIKIESGQTTKLTIQDALELYHNQLQPGIYYLAPSVLSVVHEVSSIIIREDQEHKLWIEPSAVISKARYEISKVKITLYQGKIIYVDDDGPADFSTIQAAIDDANDGDTVIVAASTYTGDGNRDIDFKGKAITVKSEEGPQKCIIDCQGTEEDKHRGFYFHSGEDANSVIQGITIINGFVGDGGAIFCERSSPTICECIIRSNTAQVQYGMDYEGSGGGIYCNYSEALIKDCIIIDNSANPRWLQVAIGGRGGGVYCSNSNLTITGCEISNNSSALDQSGAVYCWTSNITINTCISNDNQSNGIYMYRGNLEITYSLIANNKCSGIICREGNEAIVKNCDILKNRREGLNFYKIEDILINRCLIAANKHIGIFERGTSGLTVSNCTITNNRMYAIYSGAINCKISNSIIWENRILLSPSSIVDNPLCTISYSNVQGALESVGIIEDYSLNWGEGNINLDPNFASPGCWDPNGTLWTYEDDIWIEGDYHLKSQAGRLDSVSESWVQDDVTSPCIDAGDPNMPVGDEPMPNGDRINMGAYGGTPEASKSFTIINSRF